MNCVIDHFRDQILVGDWRFLLLDNIGGQYFHMGGALVGWDYWVTVPAQDVLEFCLNPQ